MFIDWLHIVVNIFAGGRSLVKTWLFLVYLISLFVLIYFSKLKSNRSVNLKQKNFLLCMVIFGYFLNLAGFCIYIFKNHLKINDSILAFANGEVSSTSLLHNHILKGVFGFIFNLFGVRNLENVDAGFVFNDKIFAPIFILAGLTLIFLLFIFLYYFWLEFKNQHGRKKIFYFIFYAVITFSLMKNIFDGGLFDREAIVSLVFFILFLFPERRRKRYIMVSVLLFYILVNLFLCFFNFFDRFHQPYQFFVSNLDSTFIYVFCLLALYLLIFRKNKFGKIEEIIIVSAGICFLSSFFVGYSIVNYRHKFIDKNNIGILAAYENIDDIDYKKFGHVGKLNFYKIDPIEQIEVGKVVDKYKILDNFYPITFPYQNCFPHGLPTVYKYDLMIWQKIDVSKWQSDFVRFDKFFLKNQNGDNHIYEINMSIEPCLPRHINIIQEVFGNLGVNNFLIVNLNEGDNIL